MTNPPITPVPASESIQINERLWQKWIWKNRELDKAGAKKRLRFFQVLLGMTVVGAVVQSVLK